MLHGLLHLIEKGEAMTSAELALCMGTNPVVVRRSLAGLREAGIVRSAKGPGGGWELNRDPAAISLLSIYRAVGEPNLLGIGHREENTSCAVEQAVNRALGSTLRDAEALLLNRFASVTLAELAADFHRQYENRAARHQERKPHV